MAAADQALIERLNACTRHARELVTAAEAVTKSGQHNIAYHLAVLALEEIGKRELIGVESVTRTTDTAPTWPTKHQLDHQQKLFWCFFGGHMYSHSMSQKEFEGARDLSRNIHMKRLSALYVDVNADGVTIPSLAVSREETETVLRLADVRVKMAESETPRDEIPEDELEMQRWFLKSTEEADNRRVIFSKASMEKLAELNDTPAWVQWLKDQFEESRAAGERAVAIELERGRVAPDLGTKPKWKIRYRVRSAAHTIRPGVLTHWNDSVSMIKLYPVSGSGNEKKRELLVEILLSDNVPIQALYHHAWGIARHFVVALNIASVGFWWWAASENQQPWFEHIEDVENRDFELSVEDSRKIDWGDKRALSPDDIRSLMLSFSSLVDSLPERPYGPLDAYVAALTYIGATDVHLPLESEAFGHFIRSLQLMMIEGGDLRQGEPIEPAFRAFVDRRESGITPELEAISSIISAYDESARGGKGTGPHLKVSYVVILKGIVDAYYLEKLQPPALSRLAERHMDSSEKS